MPDALCFDDLDEDRGGGCRLQARRAASIPSPHASGWVFGLAWGARTRTHARGSAPQAFQDIRTGGASAAGPDIAPPLTLHTPLHPLSAPQASQTSGRCPPKCVCDAPCSLQTLPNFFQFVGKTAETWSGETRATTRAARGRVRPEQAWGVNATPCYCRRQRRGTQARPPERGAAPAGPLPPNPPRSQLPGTDPRVRSGYAPK